MKRKLKPDHSIVGWIQPIGAAMSFVLVFALFGHTAAFYWMGFIFSLVTMISVNAALKTQNIGYLLITFYQLSTAVFLFVVPSVIESGEKNLIKFLTFPVMAFGSAVWGQFLMKRLKWRGREIFELAAAVVDSTMGGYTNRPLPAGHAELSRHQLLGFAEFSRRKLLALTVREENRILFFPIKEGQEHLPLLALKKKMDRMTYVAFTFDGDLSVSISEEDYLDYRQDYSFDLLCASLGAVFTGFINDYANGEEKMIIEQLDQVGYGYFS